MLDLIIKNGTLVDGTGAPATKGDLGIKDGRIAAIGTVTEAATQEIDAAGMIVSPGFIDPHTHFDAQLLWDGQARPALEHGVTTIVPGNCSLSLAPLKADHRMKLVGMFNQIEEMPLKAFKEGVVWDWETFEGFLTRIKKDLAINVAPLVGHSVLRLWVMGDAAMERLATDDELKEMQATLRTCLDAGAIGLSTSFVDMDETLQPVPSRYADQAELEALCGVLSDYGRILQVVPEFYDSDLTVARVDQLAELSLKFNIPTSFSPLFVNNDGIAEVEKVMSRVREQAQRGARVWPQVQTRPIDISFSFSIPSLLFVRLPTWYAIKRFGSHDDIINAFSNPDMRPQLLAEAQGMAGLWDTLVLRHVNTDANKPLLGKTLGEIATLRNTTAIEAMIDLSLEEDLDAHFLAADMGHNNSEVVADLLNDPLVMLGASDGGAHILSFSTYGDTGYLFGHFVREKGLITMEHAVRKVTGEPADIWGMAERGYLHEGMHADVTIFDPAAIDRGPEYRVYDVPGDGSRYVRDALGIKTVLVGGDVVWQEDGGYTDAKQGAIIPGPLAMAAE